MEVKGSEAQGRRREVGSERSVEQKHEPMYKNRIGGIPCRASGLATAKPISIKGTGCRSGGCVRKDVELTSGDLLLVPESGLRNERSDLTVRQKSAEGVIGTRVLKARTVPARG
jgi:hypothetical protein